MLKIHKQVRARKDIKGIWQYSLKRWGERQADKYYDELIKGMDLLISHPEIGVARDDI
jgi:plasmid stabilization system protein ParE